MTAVTKRSTGEPCNAKVLSTVRWGTMGKGPGDWYLACSLPNYQHGTLFGYEFREYLLEKWGRACSYCGIRGVPLQVEHIQARANGGTDRISNLCVACDSCNQAKGTQDIRVFLAEQPDLLTRILAQAKAPLKDAAAVNTTSRALYERLKVLGMPIEYGSGGLTKFNRTARKLPKKHWLDAACVGKSTPEQLHLAGVVPLLITATAHGNRQKCNVNDIGFPCSKPNGMKKVKGFQTGDIVRAVVTSGSKRGVYVGRVLVRASGSFDIRTNQSRVQGIAYRFCTPVHRCDGYRYMKEQAIPPCSSDAGRNGESSVKSPDAAIQPDYRGPSPSPGGNGTRFWRLESLATAVSEGRQCASGN